MTRLIIEDIIASQAIATGEEADPTSKRQSTDTYSCYSSSRNTQVPGLQICIHIAPQIPSTYMRYYSVIGHGQLLELHEIDRDSTFDVGGPGKWDMAATSDCKLAGYGFERK